eukprot:scaffold289850_cov35-Tisochrysis_lutea.AAC.3
MLTHGDEAVGREAAGECDCENGGRAHRQRDGLARLHSPAPRLRRARAELWVGLTLPVWHDERTEHAAQSPAGALEEVWRRAEGA